MALEDDALASLRRPADYVTPPGVDPYEAQAAASLRRPLVITPEQQAAATQDTTSQAGRGFRQGVTRLGSAGEALYGAGANLVSPGAGDNALDAAAELQRRGAQGGPRVQTYGDVHNTDDAIDYAAGLLGNAAPDVALAIGGGGIGGSIAKGLARRAGVDAAEAYAARKAAESGAESVARGAVERVAPRFVQAATDAAEPAVTAARAAGTVAGQYPSVVAGSVEGAPDAEGNLVGGLKGADRADTAKILGGDLGAAALGALPEVRLLGRIGGTAAEQAIAKNAQAILPRVAKEAATQGALGAGLGVAQTAAQFAAHKWVNDNVDLLSPHAFQSYLDSAVAGGALGAGLGGAVEGGAALGARVNADGTPNPQWGALKETIRDNLAKAGAARDAAFAKARSAFTSGDEGAPVEGAGAPTGDAQAAPEAPSAGAADLGSKIGEGAAKVHQAAVDVFSRLNSALSTDEGRAATSKAFADAVDSIKSKFDTEPLQAGIEAAFKSYRGALDGAKTPEAQADVQQAHGKVINDLISEQTPNAAESFGDNLNKLHDTTALDDRSDGVLDRISQRFESGDADALAPNDRSPATNPVKLDTPLQRQLGAALPADAPIWQFPEAMKPLMASAEKLFTGDELSARDHSNIDVLRRYAPDKVDEWEAAGPTYAKLSKGVDEHGPTPAETEAQGHSDATLTQKLEQAPLGSDEHAALQGELRNRIFRQGGDPKTGGPLVENRAGGGAAWWASKDPTKNANTVGIGTREIQTKNGPAKRVEALQLDNLISKKLAEEPGTGPVAALKSVLGDLHQAGIKVDPSTITPGKFYTHSDGTPFHLSPRDAAVIREGLKTPSKATKVEERQPAAPGEKAPVRDIEVDRPAETAQGNEGDFTDGPELVPRKEPPPTQGGVADVKPTPSPHAATITEARKAFAAAKSPRERAAAVHEAGVKIGTAELAKERAAGTINDRRFATETKRLADPESGLSRKYFNDELKGKFDAARVRETAADTAEPTSRESLRRETGDALEAAYRRMHGLEDSPRKVYQKELARAADQIAERQAAGEALAPKERTFYSAARDAGLIKGEESKHAPPVPEPVKLHDSAGDEPEHIELSSAHDHKSESEALNTVLDRLGIKDKITVGNDAAFGAGNYDTHTSRVNVGDGLKGAERVEVLAHELGHHIIRSELAKAMGVKLRDNAHLSMDQVFDKMAEHQPELHAAINADFEKWMEQHSDLNERYVDALASRKAAHRAEAISSKTDDRTLRYVAQVEPAQLKYTHSFEEYVADQISRALTHSDKSPVSKFFKGIADKLKLAYDTLFGGKGGEKYAPAPSVEKWIQGLFDQNTRAVNEALGETVPKEQARTATEAALHAAAAALPPAGAPPAGPGGAGGSLPPKGFKALTDFVKYRLPADARATLDRVLSRGKATQALEKAYADQPDALTAMRNPDTAVEAKIAYAILAGREGKVNLGPGANSILRGLSDDLLSVANLSGDGAHAERVFNDIENGRIESMVAAGKTYDVKAREAAYRGRAQSALNETRAVYDKVRTPLSKVFNASIARMRDTGVPAIRKVGALLQRHTGEAGEDPGLAPAVTHVTDRLMRSAGRIFEGLSDREVLHTLTALQRQDTGTHNNLKVATAVERTRDLFNELHKYGTEAGIFEKGQKRENYFPVLLDIKTDADRAKLTTLLSQPKFEDAIRKALGDDKVPIDQLVARMVGDGTGGGATGPADFRAKNYRLMNFVYGLGDDADKAAFASLQSKSPADIFGRYVQPLVKEAEFSRRFGADGTKLESMLAEAKKQGATDDQIAHTRSAVDGAMGRVGTDGSPVLQKLLGKNLADKIATPGARKGISYAQAYQNARLLPLSLLSSLVDPMGIAVRTGGDFKTAWDGFKVGMKSLVDKQTKEELQGMLRSLGSADDFLANDILTSGFGTKDSGGARKINDFIFNANGLAGWTKTTRFMALQAAHGFLAKHGEGATPTSKRYLDELGVRPGDIKVGADGRVQVLDPAARATASPAEQARDERVRNALLRFVDESILRPTSQQAPNWYADPYVGLVTQYKHFAYAIADQIGSRIAHEIRHGNANVLVPALSYLPIIVASEMLRGGIQYGPGGNPQRNDWGPEDYTTYALDRSGLLGPKISFAADAVGDTKRGNVPGTSFAGPTATQASQTLRGRGDIESALPGEALYKHWTSGENQNDKRPAA